MRAANGYLGHSMRKVSLSVKATPRKQRIKTKSKRTPVIYFGLLDPAVPEVIHS